MTCKLKFRKNIHIDATNAYDVTFLTGFKYPYSGEENFTVHTDPHGNGLWVNGKQAEGTCQFRGGKNVREAMRRYFLSVYPPQIK